MRPRNDSFMMLVIGSVIGCSTFRADEPRSKGGAEEDAKLIQGTWTVTELQQVKHDPSNAEKEFLKSGGYKITITADKLIHSPDKSEVKYRLNATKKPKVLESCVGDSVLARAIDELKGDDLKICQGRKPLRGEEPEPPTDFVVKKAKPGTFPTLFVLRRDLTGQTKQRSASGRVR